MKSVLSAGLAVAIEFRLAGLIEDPGPRLRACWIQEFERECLRAYEEWPNVMFDRLKWQQRGYM